jgi:selenocysteine-specific elongation factor
MSDDRPGPGPSVAGGGGAAQAPAEAAAASTAAHRVVATAGHVDHGKSTLLAALTGMEPDRLAEEQRRGLSIELGYVWTTLPATPAAPGRQRVAFVDVPGHERFVTTMLAGTGAAPAALFVVAADDGWSAQSDEHRDVLDLLGIPAVARVATKADRVEADRVAEVAEEVTSATAGTSLADGPLVVTDAVTGRGMDELRTVLRDRLAGLPAAEDRGRPRLWLDRAFTAAGMGTVVTGTLVDGHLRVGDTARLLPDGTPARIRRLQALGEDVGTIGPGTRVAANLAGVAHDALRRGDVLVVGGSWRTTCLVDLWVRVLPGQRLDRTGAWRLHVGTASVGCRLSPLTGPVDGDGEGAVRVLLDRALPLASGDRVVLREVGRRATVAGGVVADPLPGQRVRGRDARARRAAAIAVVASAGAGPELVTALVEAAGGTREVDEVRAAAGWPADTQPPAGLAVVGGHLVAEARLAAWVATVRELGPGTHDRTAVAARARDAGAPAALAAALPDHLVAAGVLVRTTHGVSLPEHAAAVADERRGRADAVVAALAAAPFAPPDLDELAADLGLDHRERAALVGSGRVVRCGAVAFARSAVDRAEAIVRDLEARTGPFTASQAREAFGTTRRYAIPLLEHLDRIGVTAFDGRLRRTRTRHG